MIKCHVCGKYDLLGYEADCLGTMRGLQGGFSWPGLIVRKVRAENMDGACCWLTLRVRPRHCQFLGTDPLKAEANLRTSDFFIAPVRIAVISMKRKLNAINNRESLIL